MRPPRGLAIALTLCGLVVSAGCIGPMFGTNPDNGDDPGSLELSNNWDQDVEYTIYVNGNRRANITVQPGETVRKPDFINTSGRTNLTIIALGTTSTFDLLMTRDDGTLSGPSVEIEVDENGTVIGAAG